jgi:hypothetical protein
MPKPIDSTFSSVDRCSADRDGVPERCFQVSFGAFTLGECDEL